MLSFTYYDTSNLQYVLYLQKLPLPSGIFCVIPGGIIKKSIPGIVFYITWGCQGIQC